MTMKRISRLVLAAAGVAAVTAFGAGQQTASAADVELKIALFSSPNHPLWKGMLEKWGNEFTNAGLGVSFKGYPGGQIGGAPPGAFKRVVNGISDVELHLPGYTSTVFPRTLVMEIPNQHATPSAATQAWWKIHDKHMASEYERVKLLAAFATDTPALMTNKIVKVPSDLTGLKLRTPSDNQAHIISGLGATPVAMPMTQTYSSIEKGVVDGAIVGVSVVRSFKIIEVAKYYVNQLPMGYSPIIVAMNKGTYDGLDAKQRAWVDENSGLDYSMVGATSYERAEKASLKTIKETEGRELVELTEAELKAWDAPFDKIVSEWVERFEKQGLPYRQILNDYLAAGS